MMTANESAQQSAGEPVIVCKDIAVGYGPDLVLNDVTLSIPSGAFVLIMGPNGAGKTTLVKAMLGLLKLRSGRITTFFDGMPPGYVPQQKTIDPLFPVSIRKIVEMGLYAELGWWGRISGDHRRRVDETLRRFNLLEHDRKIFSELSAGMRQKTLIARAFVNGADVFILDEPASELDEQSEREVVEHLHRLTRQGKTVLVVHHGMGYTVQRSDMVCVVNHGQATMLKPDQQFSIEQLAEAARRGRGKGEAHD